MSGSFFSWFMCSEVFKSQLDMGWPEASTLFWHSTSAVGYDALATVDVLSSLSMVR